MTFTDESMAVVDGCETEIALAAPASNIDKATTGIITNIKTVFQGRKCGEEII